MSWLRLLEPSLDRLLNHLATKLAEKIDIELEAAVDAALDQTEMRIRELLNRAEARMLAAVGQCAARPCQLLDEAAQAAGMVPVSTVRATAQATAQAAAQDAAAVAADEIRAILRRQGNAGGQRSVHREVPDR